MESSSARSPDEIAPKRRRKAIEGDGGGEEVTTRTAATDFGAPSRAYVDSHCSKTSIHQIAESDGLSKCKVHRTDDVHMALSPL